jgi:hypothetical protein
VKKSFQPSIISRASPRSCMTGCNRRHESRRRGPLPRVGCTIGSAIVALHDVSRCGDGGPSGGLAVTEAVPI